MRTLSLITAILSGITLGVCKIWAIISFVLYLAKDRNFDWWSIWIFLISLVVVIVSYCYYLFTESKPIVKSNNKSSFQARLEEMEKQRKSTQTN